MEGTGLTFIKRDSPQEANKRTNGFAVRRPARTTGGETKSPERPNTHEQESLSIYCKPEDPEKKSKLDVATFVDETFGPGTELDHEMATNAPKEALLFNLPELEPVWRKFNKQNLWNRYVKSMPSWLKRRLKRRCYLKRPVKR